MIHDYRPGDSPRSNPIALEYGERGSVPEKKGRILCETTFSPSVLCDLFVLSCGVR